MEYSPRIRDGIVFDPQIILKYRKRMYPGISKNDILVP